MDTEKCKPYLAIAQATGAFTPAEIEVLQEVLGDVRTDGAPGYRLLDIWQEDALLGYILFGRTPMTGCAWDIYWIVVRREAQRAGAGGRLLQLMEQQALEQGDKAVIRVETGGKQEYGNTRKFYIKAGFEETGRIRDFYADGDDLVVFSKTIVKTF